MKILQARKGSDLRNQHRLVVVLDQHVLVGGIDDGEDVRRHFRGTFSTVQLDDLVGIDGQSHVGVDGDAEKTGVGLHVGWKKGKIC